ncbi:SHOCT domain-containing protein [Nocardia brasiliensis]|uniref:SHOCT domain-containing protein n=1 Tax=Nocardia brasiliensis TaxID=37326 RepID=UPI0006892A77|nr:SHOCT domain-containing protein [Nocardia brasiliensis]
MMYWYGDAPHWWMFALMIVFALPLWVAVVVAIMALSRGEIASEPKSQGPVRLAPEALLAERFASGELDETEYLRRLAVLRPASAQKPSDSHHRQH